MRVAIVTFDGFNEIDSFVISAMLNRVKRAGWKAEITAPSPVAPNGRPSTEAPKHQGWERRLSPDVGFPNSAMTARMEKTQCLAGL